MANPVAMITGASVGIGEQFARQLSERGHDTVIVARDAARLEVLAKEIESGGATRAEVLVADLTDAAQLARVEERAHAVDVLVNNAGFGTFGSFHTLDIDTEIREIDLNVVALVRLTHAAASAMAERGRGGILNVSSLAGFQPGPSNATYGATKAFVTSFTEAVHEELKGTGVRVTVLCPGFTHTEFQERANVPASDLPGFLWQEAPEVARAGLDGLARNRAIVIPGAANKVMGNLSAVTPHAITRRVGAAVLKRASY
ncbi:MAG TPA: SDR family oxidoreductase [Acidimicrobiia bacterium]|nr:SDR family oxidoreductase [Acidimicrobiia bacterium]